jgi:HK97 gp10 family phage protein
MAAKLVNLKGGAELQKFLQELPVKLERNIMRSALRAGAKVIADEAKQNVPVDDGDLKRSIRVSTNTKKGKVTASAKAGDKRAWYWRFVEFGTAAHTIKGKNGNPLFFNGAAVMSVNHPGARAKPFMRPALDSKSNEAINAVGQQIGKRLNKIGLNAPAILEVDNES